MKLTITALLFATMLSAQSLKLPVSLENLSRIATETVDVTMEGSMLRFAERFLSDRDPDQATAKRILRGLNAIYVKEFEFSSSKAYSESDLDSIRTQLKAPDWSRLVHVKGLRENTEVYAQSRGSEVSGLVVLNAENRKLTIVHIDGQLRPEELASLSGRAGLPRWNFHRGHR